jgi:hypothetical protein
MTRKQKVRRQVGDVVAVPLSAKVISYALLLQEPLIVFLAATANAGTSGLPEGIHSARALFSIWVANQPVQDGSWPVAGRVDPVPDHFLSETWFFKQDPISKALTIGRTGAEEIPATATQVIERQLERAAVWSASHVEERLRDHFAGRANKWVESLKLKA